MIIKNESKNNTTTGARKFYDKNISKVNKKGAFTLDCNWELQVICDVGILARELLPNPASNITKRIWTK